MQFECLNVFRYDYLGRECLFYINYLFCSLDTSFSILLIFTCSFSIFASSCGNISVPRWFTLQVIRICGIVKESKIVELTVRGVKRLNSVPIQASTLTQVYPLAEDQQVISLPSLLVVFPPSSLTSNR